MRLITIFPHQTRKTPELIQVVRRKHDIRIDKAPRGHLLLRLRIGYVSGGSSPVKMVAFVLLAISIPVSSFAQRRDQVLRKAYDLSKGVAARDRAFFLRALTIATNRIAPKRDLLSWCQDLADTSQQVERWNRYSHRKNAALACAQIDPRWALEQLMSLGIPPPGPDGESLEDVRSDAAGRGLTSAVRGGNVDVPGIMELYYRRYGGKRLNDLRRLARHLGDTGLYPYDGWRIPIEDLHAHGRQSQVDKIFDECLWYYKRGSRYKNESEVFLRLLQAVQGKVTDVLYREGRAAFLEFNPKFDFNSPPKATARPGPAPVRLAPELTSLVEALTLVENGATEYRSNLLVFLVAAQKVLEANFIKTDQTGAGFLRELGARSVDLGWE